MMDKSDKDFEWAVGLNRLSLNLIGVWPGTQSQRTFIAPAMASMIFVWYTLPQMYALVQVYRQPALVIENLTTNVTSIAASIKILVLWKGRDVIKVLISQIKDDWFSEKSVSELRSMQKHAGNARLLTEISYCTTFTYLLLAGLMPMFKWSFRTVNNITDPHPSRLLPMQTCYPYDVYESPIFELTYLSQFIASSIVSASLSVPETFFSALVCHACAQFEIVEAQLTHLVKNPDLLSYYGRCIHQIVSHHVRLIRKLSKRFGLEVQNFLLFVVNCTFTIAFVFVANIENVFNLLILTHILYAAALIAFLGFSILHALDQDTKALKFFQVSLYVVVVIDLMLHVLIFCALSGLLLSKSFRLFSAGYQFELQTLPKNYARDILIIMMRSQWPLELTAGKFFSLSHTTYLQFIKSVFGYLSMLITMK